MNPLMLIAAKDFLVKYWRESTIVLLTLLLLISLGGVVQTRKQLKARSAALSTAEESLSKTAEVNSALTWQVNAAEEKTRTLQVQLTQAKQQDSSKVPVLLANGVVAYREDTHSSENNASTLTEKTILEFKYAQQGKMLEDSQLALTDQKRQVQELKQSMDELETKTAGSRHISVLLGADLQSLFAGLNQDTGAVIRAGLGGIVGPFRLTVDAAILAPAFPAMESSRRADGTLPTVAERMAPRAMVSLDLY